MVQAEFFDQLTKFGISMTPIIPVVWAVLKQHKEQKKDYKVIVDGLRELNSENVIRKESQEKTEKKIEFDQLLISTLQDTRSQIIRASSLSSVHKSLLRTWSKMIEELATSYYYHKYRGVKYKMKNFLEVELNDIINRIKEIIKHDINESKIVKYDFNGNPTIVYFHDWIIDENSRKPFARMELLGVALEHNGFDDKENPESPNFIETMDENLGLILEAYIKEVLEWEKIVIPDVPTTAINYMEIL